MKNKEKQIEEMAKDMGVSFQLAGTTRFGAVAEALIRFGWIKPDKDSVVLSREEYQEKLDERYSTGYYFGKQDAYSADRVEESNSQDCEMSVSEQVSKETAEKIYSFVVDYYDNEYFMLNLQTFIKEQFGFEIKE